MLYLITTLLFLMIAILLFAVVLVLRGLFHLINLKKQGSLSSRLRRVIRFLEREESVTYEEYSDYLGISPDQSRADLSFLEELGLVEKAGQRKEHYYRYLGKLSSK